MQRCRVFFVKEEKINAFYKLTKSPLEVIRYHKKSEKNHI